MTTLLNWLRDLFGFLGNWFIECFRIAKNYVTSFWAFAVAVVGIAWVIVNHIVAIIALLLDSISGLVTGDWSFTPPDGISTILAGANTFFPLQEFFGYLITYGILLTVLTVYRIIKSYVPTVGSA